MVSLATISILRIFTYYFDYLNEALLPDVPGTVNVFLSPVISKTSVAQSNVIFTVIFFEPISLLKDISFA